MRAVMEQQRDCLSSVLVNLLKSVTMFFKVLVRGKGKKNTLLFETFRFTMEVISPSRIPDMTVGTSTDVSDKLRVAIVAVSFKSVT